MVDFSQSSVAFKNSYNPVFLADLESVPYKEKNEDASPYNLYEVFKEEGPVPDGGTWLEAFLFLGIFALLESVFVLIVWALNSQEVPWLFFLLLGGLFVYHVYRIVSWRLFMRKLATAWKNGWIDCYPAWLGSLYFDENNVKSGKSKYFYRTKLMIMAPSGEHTPLRILRRKRKARASWSQTGWLWQAIFEGFGSTLSATTGGPFLLLCAGNRWGTEVWRPD